LVGNTEEKEEKEEAPADKRKELFNKSDAFTTIMSLFLNENYSTTFSFF
jgi:hypothetical protein